MEINTGRNPKGNNNQKDWTSIEEENPKTIKIKNTVIDTEVDIFETSQKSEDEITEVDVFENEDSDDNFDEVLQLTQYEGGLIHDQQTSFVVAEYDKIDIVNIDKETEKVAKNFVSRVTKFILEFNDVTLTSAHKDYIKETGKLQLSNLKDLLSLVSINKQMINNIINRVNATQAEDYAIINSYNILVNQHIKLIKDVSTMYKAIPSVMKKMRADVLTNQELENNGETGDEVVTEDYGETQFNNGKQLLKSILMKKNPINQET